MSIRFIISLRFSIEIRFVILLRGELSNAKLGKRKRSNKGSLLDKPEKESKRDGGKWLVSNESLLIPSHF